MINYLCHYCNKPAVASWNINANAASCAPSVMVPVCAEHRPEILNFSLLPQPDVPEPAPDDLKARARTLVSMMRATVHFNDTGQTPEDALAVMVLQEQDKVRELRAENEQLKAMAWRIQSGQETIDHYANSILALTAERDELRAAALMFQKACESMYRNPGKESYWFDAPYNAAVKALSYQTANNAASPDARATPPEPGREGPK